MGMWICIKWSVINPCKGQIFKTDDQKAYNANYMCVKSISSEKKPELINSVYCISPCSDICPWPYLNILKYYIGNNINVK